jgi:hypothetical protein
VSNAVATTNEVTSTFDVADGDGVTFTIVELLTSAYQN